MYKLASTKEGSAVGKLADQTVSIKTGFSEYHSAVNKIKKDLEHKNSKKKVWAVECRGDTDIYLFIASSFADVRKKIEGLPARPAAIPVEVKSKPKKKK